MTSYLNVNTLMLSVLTPHTKNKPISKGRGLGTMSGLGEEVSDISKKATDYLNCKGSFFKLKTFHLSSGLNDITYPFNIPLYSLFTVLQRCGRLAL